MASAGSAWERRRVLGLPAVAAGGMLVSSAHARTPAAVAAPAEEVPPTEDLMREHGILKRVLLIYQEAERRLRNGTRLPPEALHDSADIIRTFIEQYHEHLEETFVFPRLRKAGKLVDTVQVLKTQHDKGRILTGRILAGATAQGLADARTRDRVIGAMRSFDRMYSPHEAREDTVVFPTFRDIMPAREFAEMGERFEDEEHRRFGAAGFTGVVDRVAGIEKELGIYDLTQFTPHV
ncbi:hemerythrin domain-containing protein [Actinoallomurus rhizosphaericola]|uniref:hemerythrin domain-containing protein n=1 Tax=Actinoallomurus rhizosphaericola TaxID=2952536 RepID=UPI0020936AE9|nr:hemerythrin domain-containing protein [Actinoallomurus rhizosphaericola]MCO5996078.1 hemerythrin domain-containing protein [Actinoallomurus rhizosphaericola]